MKYYIFVTENIKGAGGVQCYVAAKARYLSQTGWKVKVLSSTTPTKKDCLVTDLNSYLDGDIFEICLPPFQYPKWFQRRILKKMLKVTAPACAADEIIIESHNCATSQWAELLASKLGAQHFFYTMNEHYRGKGKHYVEQMEFYAFKFGRREILGSKNAKSRLLDGYVEVTDENAGERAIIDEAPIQDVESPKVDALQPMDWNICYLGRGNKPYVEKIIEGVGLFAGRHQDKQVQFVVVGDFDMHRGLLEGTLEQHANLKLCELGFLFPLPRRLYEKVDVFIAGSGSARHSAEVGALVIIPDTETRMANGLLGYETLETIYQGKDSVVTTFEDALERVLVERIQDRLPNRYPARVGVEECTRQNFELYAKAEQKKEYYPQEKLMKGRRDWKRFLGILGIMAFPALYKLIKQ